MVKFDGSAITCKYADVFFVFYCLLTYFESSIGSSSYISLHRFDILTMI